VNVEKHISSLLFRYDCVIIPGFGGFVTNYASAKIHPTQHTFSPPAKNIVFNRNLKNNDGLLANCLAEEEKLSYQEALKMINEFAGNCVAVLNGGKKLVIAEVGTLYHDVEKNIQFEPDKTINYLLESFGLNTFQSPAIKRDNFVQRLEKEPKDREVIPAEVKRRVNVKRYVALTLSAAALFAIVWIPLKTDLLKGINYANLNPFSKKEKSLYAEKNITPVSYDEHTLNKPNSFELVPDTAKFMRLSFTKQGVDPMVVKMNEETAVESTAVSNTAVEKTKSSSLIGTSKSGKYSIIGGCFAIPENADRFVKTLKTQGYDAFILETNRSILRHVTYGSFSTREEAISALAKIRSTNPEAWLFVN
jgi:cell division septation protein DedD